MRIFWLAAGLGAAAGCGLWQMSLMGTLMSLIILSGVKKLKKSPSYKSPKTLEKETASIQDRPQQ